MKHRFARLIATGVCILLATGVSAPAFASPSSLAEKKAEAARLQAQIDANGEKISMLAERYNEAQLRLDDATKNIARVKTRLETAQSESNRIRGLVGLRAASMYMHAGTSTVLDDFNVADARELGTRSKYAETTAAVDSALLDRLRASGEDLRLAKSGYEKAQKQARGEVDAIEANRREVEAANAEQAHLLAQANGEIATLIKEEAARRAAAEKAASDAALARLRQAASPSTPDGPVVSGGRDPGNRQIPDTPAPSPGAAAAVAYAKAQLGKPYRYAGVGPNSYDCSGLTMMAWAQAGVSMPHGSIAQGNMFPRVPDNAMAPGDLVIYYPDHHHVGMYVGGGMTVSATHTGDFVRLQPVFRSGFQFAVRPG